MFVQSCPKCGSGRVRRGYRQASIFLRVIGINYLLCNNCNLHFKGFGLFGASAGSRQRRNEAKNADERFKEKFDVKIFPLPHGAMTQSALDAAMRVGFEGYTRDFNAASMSIVVPDAGFGEAGYTCDKQRLLVHLKTETKESAPPLRVQATVARCEPLDDSATGAGWLVGTRLTWLTPEDQARYTFFLKSLK